MMRSTWLGCTPMPASARTHLAYRCTITCVCVCVFVSTFDTRALLYTSHVGSICIVPNLLFCPPSLFSSVFVRAPYQFPTCLSHPHPSTQGVTLQLTQGVVKNIIPAIPSTNAIVAAACTMEALKAITMCSSGMNNYMMYVGSEGIYTHTVAYERDPQCPVCSAGVPLSVASDTTLEAVMQAMVQDARLGPLLSAPSVSYGTSNLYMRGVLEEVGMGGVGVRVLCFFVLFLCVERLW